MTLEWNFFKVQKVMLHLVWILNAETVTMEKMLRGAFFLGALNGTDTLERI